MKLPSGIFFELNGSALKPVIIISLIFSAAAVCFAAGTSGSPAEAFLPAQAQKYITISEGITRVLRDSRAVKAVLPEADMAFQDTLAARSALLPHLGLSAEKAFYRYQPASRFGGNTVFTSEKEPFSAGLDLYQTLFDFGKSLAAYRASKEAFNAEKANIESVKRMAVLEFIVAYFDLLQSEKMIAVAEKEVESLTSYLNDIQHLYEQGVVIKNDLLPARVRLADASQRLIAARHNRELAQARLNAILAFPLHQPTLARDIQMQPPELPPIEEAWKISESQRAEVAFLDNLAQASRLNEKAKSRSKLPTIFARGDYSRVQNQYLAHENNGALRLGARIDLYEGGADSAELEKERARGRQLSARREKLVEDIKLEVKNSYVRLNDAREKVGVARSALDQADENVRVNRVKYAEGIGTSTDVLEAITLQTGARTNYYGADYELKRVYARLMYSMGIDLALVYERIDSGEDERTK